jgi:3-dehydroquinate synthase
MSTTTAAAADTTVHVPLSGGREYDIHIGAGLLARAGELLKSVARSPRAVIVTQPKIAALYAPALSHSLVGAGFETPDVVTFPAGERHKHLGTVTRLCGALYDLPVAVDRRTLIIALGGGVVGDVAGFLAAMYLRGLDYVQVPTTLLAMVDSSVGGKTGVDLKAGKNLVGAFHQPRAVLADTDTLKSLPAREFTSGMAEVVKYGVIRDPELLQTMTRGAEGEGAMAGSWSSPARLADIVRRSCEIKADVVANDELETTGLRAILNYGHTIGHALESVTNYRRYKHGEAVAIGMVAAACIGEAVGVTPEPVRQRIVGALRWQRLPLAVPDDIAADDLIALTGRDKKAERGRAKFVLARALGDVYLTGDVDEAAVRAGLARQKQLYGVGGNI